MNKSLKADLMLLLVTLGWGLSYYFVDICLREMEVFTLNAFRFLVAFAVAAILSFKHLKKVNKDTLLYSLFLGFILSMVYVGATYGVKYTTLSNTGFLCSLTVIFTPILTFIYYKIKPSRKTFFSIVLCFIGICLLTLSEDFTINFSYIKGDLFSIMCAFSYAHHLLVTDKALKNPKVNPYQVSIFQLLFCGIFNLLLALALETPSLPSTGNVWAAALFLAIVCSGIPFIVQTQAQRYTTATHVALIFSLEPVFAGIVAFVLAGEILTARSYLGGIIMILSIFIMELNFPFKKSKKLV